MPRRSAPGRPGRPRRAAAAERTESGIQGWITQAGTVAGSATALLVFVYFVGGVVMWSRFHTAALPADQGVALMSKQQLLVVGLRLMVIPAIVAGLVGFAAVRVLSADPSPQTRLWSAMAA